MHGLFLPTALAEGLGRTSAGARSGGGAEVVVGDPDRAYLPRRRFARLGTHRVPESGLLEAEEVKPATVWRLP